MTFILEEKDKEKISTEMIEKWFECAKYIRKVFDEKKSSKKKLTNKSSIHK